MKLEAIKNYPPKLIPGDVVEIDRMVADKDFAGGIKVRIVKTWSRPKWLAITFFIDCNQIEVPHDDPK